MNKIDARLAELAISGRSHAPKGSVLGEIAQKLTRNDPDRIILSDGTRDLTRHDMLDCALRLGGGLRARGLTRGAVIAFQLPNWWEACALNLAAALFGYRIVPLLTIYRRAELQEMMSACGVDAIFIPRSYKNTNYPALIASLATPPRLVFTVRDGGPDSFEHLVSTPPTTPDSARSDDAKLIIFTSGSTGHPKGVIHSHDTMDALIRQAATFWGIGEDDSLYVASPIGHVGGAIYAFEFPWITGCQVFLEESWTPAQAVARIDAKGITFMAGATPFLSGLIKAANNAGSTLPSLRRFVCGGASVPPELVRQGLKTFPTAVISRAYGSSEVALVCPGTRTRVDAEAHAATDGENIVDVRILDKTGSEVTNGNEGEVAVRAPQMFLGYLNPEDETACFTKDGYFRMGDLGRRVDGRFIVITGRTKDIIIRKGENISPVEIENALMRHAAVAQCSVVGRPDAARGEMVVAFVVLQNDATFDFTAMTQHLDDLGLARQKFPECLKMIDFLPVNSVGKVQKPQLREMAKQLSRTNQHQAGCPIPAFLPTKTGHPKAKGDENMSQEGTKAIRRAAAILQRIAHISANNPATLSDISKSLDLPRSTTHRILKCLTETRLATYDSKSRRYEIGMLGYELGLAVTDRVLNMAPYIAAVDRIAQRANVTTYLMRRSGIEAVCVHKAEGRTVIRVIPVEVGQRRFLGVGAGATALLAGLGDAALERILTSIEPDIEQFHSLTPDTIRASVVEARASGFAQSRSRVYSSIYGLGFAISAHLPEPDLAISIAVHAPEVNDDRIREWKSIIKEEAAAAQAASRPQSET